MMMKICLLFIVGKTEDFHEIFLLSDFGNGGDVRLTEDSIQNSKHYFKMHFL